jgi:hypothetical protein
MVPPGPWWRCYFGFPLAKQDRTRSLTHFHTYNHATVITARIPFKTDGG